MVDERQKIEKKKVRRKYKRTGQIVLKQSPKNEIWTKVQMIQNLIFGILFWKILIRPYNFFIFVQTFQWISSKSLS